MKSKIVIKLTIFLALTLILNIANGQCTQHVTHLSGTSTVGGIQVTVTSSGDVTHGNLYCPVITEPYGIGSTNFPPNHDGSYTFQFVPAIESLSLNFSGIHNNNNLGVEIIKLLVNGLHYPIPSAGSLNGCDSLAMLTSAGNITGCVNCGFAGAGWKGTTITGQISSLTVLDSVISNSPNGAVFSLFICNEMNLNITKNDLTELQVYPNPAIDRITIDGLNKMECKYSISDIFGKNIPIDPIAFSNRTEIDISNLKSGIYFLVIESESMLEIRKVLIN